MSASQGTGGGFGRAIKLFASALASFVAAAGIVSVSLSVGGPLTAGLFVGLENGLFAGVSSTVAWTVILFTAGYAAYSSGQFSIPFGISLVAVLALLAEFLLPAWATRPFAVVSEVLLGQQIQVDAVTFAILSGTAIALYWGLYAYIWGRGKKFSTVVNRIRIQAERLVREYAKAGAAIAGFAVAVWFIVGSQTGEFLGEVFTMVASAPVVSGYAATLAGYYGAFIRDVPILRQLDPTLFGAAALVVFLLAVSWKYSSALDN